MSLEVTVGRHEKSSELGLSFCGQYWWQMDGWTGWSLRTFPTLLILWFYEIRESNVTGWFLPLRHGYLSCTLCAIEAQHSDSAVFGNWGCGDHPSQYRPSGKMLQKHNACLSSEDSFLVWDRIKTFSLTLKGRWNGQYFDSCCVAMGEGWLEGGWPRVSAVVCSTAFHLCCL